jgi:hypothetical protein
MAKKKVEVEVEEEEWQGYTKVPGFPWPLRKAVDDLFSYLAIFRNGWHVEFKEAKVDDNPDWVTLLEVEVGHLVPWLITITNEVCVSAFQR